MSAYTERPLVFDCAGETLVGILGVPALAGTRGLLVLVGGPQYRAGSHRQFTLLARELASAGVAVLRFDYRGMGDSTGRIRAFEAIDTDIRCAIDALFANVSGLQEVVIWGLCDAASAALFYAHRDARVSGLVLANPWMRTEQGAARAYLKHYYTARLLQMEFWRKLARGEWNMRESLASLRRFAGQAAAPASAPAASESVSSGAGPLPQRMADGWRRFGGRLLLILSGNDLVAREFSDIANGSRVWRRLLRDPRVTREALPEANHTFARREWRDRVAHITRHWLQSW